MNAVDSRPDPRLRLRRGRLLATAFAGTLTAAAGACTSAPAEPFDPVEASIADVHAALRAGTATCREVVQAHLDRIAAYDDATVNAVSVINPRALERADSLDAAAARRVAGDSAGADLLVSRYVRPVLRGEAI